VKHVQHLCHDGIDSIWSWSWSWSPHVADWLCIAMQCPARVLVGQSRADFSSFGKEPSHSMTSIRMESMLKEAH